MNSAKIKKLVKQVKQIWKPPPRLTVSQWADMFRYLSPESSAEPGKWKTERAIYQKGIMDAVNDPKVERIVFQKSAQVGATEIINNIVGYFIDQDPSPILVIQPTVEMAKTWSKDRLSTMLRDSPCFKDKVKDAKSRDGNNTILHKTFPGGHITIIGANAPSGLASRPIRIVLADEVDRYPHSAGEEGDPLKLAEKRTTTFWNRKIIAVSTPTIKGLSKIENLFELSDKRYFYVPCPHCNYYQTLKWANVYFENNDPSTAVYVCENCGAILKDSDRLKMIRKGEWRATAEFKGTAGFHLNELYSPWSSLKKIVADFLEAKKDPEKLKVFVNTTLGETWEEEGEQIDEDELLSRRENYDKVPMQAAVLTAGVDIQKDRIEVEVVAWGKDEESWSIDYRVFYGNPAKLDIWKQLDAYLNSTFEHESGTKLKISCTCIDSGYHTVNVYQFTKPRELNRVFAVKGVAGQGQPIVSRPTLVGKKKAKLFKVGVDTIKETIYSRLKIDEPGPGYMHFPIHYDKEYFKQLTAEKLVTKYKKGRPYREWVKLRERNEALDCRVYAYAAYHILNPNIEKILETFQNYPREKQKTEEKEKKKIKKRTASRWVRRF